MYLALLNIIAVPYWAVLILFGSIGLATIALFTISLPTMLTHFQGRSAEVAGAFMQTFYGMGNIVWPLVYQYGIGGEDLSHCFLLLLIVMGIGQLCNLLFLGPKDVEMHVDPEAIRLLSQTKINTAAADAPKADPTSSLAVIKELVTSLEFYGIVFVFFLNFGASINIIANAGEILLSIHGDPNEIPRMLIIYGAMQTVGRLWCTFWPYSRKPTILLLIFSQILQIAIFLAAYLVLTPVAVMIYAPATVPPLI